MLKTANKKGTVEGFLKRWLGGFSIILLALVAYVLTLLQIELSNILFILLIISCVLFVTSKFVFDRVFESYSRVSQHLEALSSEEYTQHSRSMYSHGVVADIHAQLVQFSQKLKQSKRLYNENSFIIFNLIEQLNTPILMFNQKLQLSHANSAFTDVYGVPWQAKRKSHINQLDLIENGNRWELEQKRAGGKRWQIRQSYFQSQNEVFLLLVFVDLERTYREAEHLSWRKLIRILSHEIRNSLTPISSLADALEQNETISARGKQALNVISERSNALQSFMSRYADISKPLELQPTWFKADKLMEKLSCLFTEQKLVLKGNTVMVFADYVLLEQVLINLLKNAAEASLPESENIGIEFATEGNKVRITVRDNGHGIANIQDVMTPFYTTKPEGQGLGLAFCQNIVRHHGGELTLSNRSDKSGAIATLLLPHPSA